MSLKDLFKSSKSFPSSSLEDIAKELESHEYIESYEKEKVRFLPNVDYADPKNFAFYGSAEKYYSDAFLRIRSLYPYDGSQKEKIDWLNESTFLDLYIFEHRYPRFNGHANFSSGGWGAYVGSKVGGYGTPATQEYIKTFGGPHASGKSTLPLQFDDANKYATSGGNTNVSWESGSYRESNLSFNLSGGVTLEMWLKKPAFNNSLTEKEVLFDLWNGELSSSAQYGRLRLELDGNTSGSPFLLTAISGTSTGFQNQVIGADITAASITDWTHVAVTLKNSGSDVSINTYINGAFNQSSSVSNEAMGQVTGSLISFIGALQTAPSGNTYNAYATTMSGSGKFSGSMDEFRFWKSERTSKEIGRFYWTNIGAGTNTDEANARLGVYYKFNEGITQTSSVDSLVLDYSGRVSNGVWTGYQSGSRSTESAMVLSSASVSEFKDPTINSSHPDFVTVLQELEQSGSMHDIQNNSALFHTMPAWIAEEDDTKDGNLRNLTQIMGSYFDNLFLHIKEINSLKDIYSHFQTKSSSSSNTYDDLLTETSTTGSVKPLPFADRLLTNAGFVAPELFADATVLEALATRSEDEHYDMKIANVKNQIYQNVYANLINIYKKKGTNRAFRNILHSFGVDEDVVKINFYGDNVDFEINDRYKIKSAKEKFVDFNHTDRFAGSVYQSGSGGDYVSFISGTTGDFEKYIPMTFETQIILPDKISWWQEDGFETPFTKSVITGMHEANPAAPTDFTIPATDYCGIQIYAERDQKESKRVRFHLSSSVLGVHVSSSLYAEQYKNNEWLLSFRIKHDRYPNIDFLTGSTSAPPAQNYTIDFLGYNTVENYTINSFNKTAALTQANAQNFLKTSKRIYAGARHSNFTGSLVEQSDVKVGFARYWMNYLSDETLLQHSYDSTNYGAESPFRSAYFLENRVNNIKIPEIDTLILNWDFNKLTTSDSSGQFVVDDYASGSGETRYVADFENVKRKFYTGKGSFFLANDAKAIDVEYLSIARSTFPEILQGDDMIEIRRQDDVKFTKETLPTEYYIAFEKSMAQTVSEEMIKFMSSITDFNNLIGRPIDRYRMEYKSLNKLRELFFERVSNEPDLDKYVDYYKWLDDALGEMLVELVPASLSHSDGINNVIENYIFARDKYFNKFPTIEFKEPVLEVGMNTINRHLYPWKTGHAPIETPTDSENENCFWWLERAGRDETPLSSSVAGHSASKVKIFQARKSVLDRSFTTAQHLDIDRMKILHGGTNYDDHKNRQYVWAATKEHGETPLTYGEYGGYPLRYLLANSDTFEALKDCNDDVPVTRKLKRAFQVVDGFSAFHGYMSGNYDGGYKGGMLFPFNVMSSSVTTGYTSDLHSSGSGKFDKINIVNVHSDTYTDAHDIPMQGPFTQAWVGGHQSRHIDLNGKVPSLDTMTSRPEGYLMFVRHIEDGKGAIGVTGVDYPYEYGPYPKIARPRARYFREEKAKRPVNIRNIKTSTSNSVLGNYSKNYEIIHTSARTQNNLGLRNVNADVEVDLIDHKPLETLKKTTQRATLVATTPRTKGNSMSSFQTSSLYHTGLEAFAVKTELESANETVITSKFSAPGGFETLSNHFLDVYAREFSVYNALPFRNLKIRGKYNEGTGSISGYSGESVQDIHSNSAGLNTHLTRHSAQFGYDSVAGTTASPSASYHKVNRNSKWFSELDSSGAETGAYDRDNWWHQHQIPQSDYQYKWVKSSHTGTLATSSLDKPAYQSASLSGHILDYLTVPSGNTSLTQEVGYIVPSQSCMAWNGSTKYSGTSIDRIDNITIYGYPTWEQIRNNDKLENVAFKKQYGYSYIKEEQIVDTGTPNAGTVKYAQATVDESRATAHIPHLTQLKYNDTNYAFKYPYVNIKYHFDNSKLRDEGYNPSHNTTMYESLYGYYHGIDPENHSTFSFERINIRQNVYPQFIKHTKYNVRHRHYFVSHFWTDGENDLYNTDIGPASYEKLDEKGRRELSVTATLFDDDFMNARAEELKLAGAVTNVIPSQSIWSMDSRTYMTGGIGGNAATAWNPITAASNSAGAPGVLQNRDHHFHNNVSAYMLNTSGSPAVGSFQSEGATVFGIKSSGRFTVHGIVPTGDKASGSFEVTGANVQGTSGVASFDSISRYQSSVAATNTFQAIGNEVNGTYATASFQVSGAAYDGTAAIYEFKAKKQHVAGTAAQSTFRVNSNAIAEAPSQGKLTIHGMHRPAQHSTGAFEITGYHVPATSPQTTLDVAAPPRYGDRAGLTFKLKSPTVLSVNNNYNGTGVTITAKNYRTVVTSSIPADSNTDKYIATWKYGKYYRKEGSNNGYLRRDASSNSVDGFTVSATSGLMIGFWIRIDGSSGAGNDITGNGTYTLFESRHSSAQTIPGTTVQVRKTVGGNSLRCRRYFDGNSSDYRQTDFVDFFDDDRVGDDAWHHVLLTWSGGSSGAWTAKVDGSASSWTEETVSTTTGGTITGDQNDMAGDLIIGDVSSKFTPKLDEVVFYKDDGNGVPTAAQLFNADGNGDGRWVDINTLTTTQLVSWYPLGDYLMDSATSFYDIANNSNNNTLEDNVNTANHGIGTDRSKEYSVANLRSDSEFEAAWLSLFNANVTNTTINQNTAGTFFLNGNGLAQYDGGNNVSWKYLTPSKITNTVGVGEGATVYDPLAQYSDIAPVAAKNDSTLKQGDSLTIVGSTLTVKHTSLQDAGNIATFGSNVALSDEYYFGGSWVNNANKAYSVKAIKFVGEPRGYLYNTNYQGLTSTSTDMTISFWYKSASTDTGNNAYILVSHDQVGSADSATSSNNSMRIYRYGSSFRVRIYSSTGTDYTRWDWDGLCATDKYRHYVLVIDRGNPHSVDPILYVDGVAVSADNETVNSGGTPSGGMKDNRSIWIGDYPTNSNDYEINGYLTQFAIWNTKLSADEAAEVHNDGRWKNLLAHPEAHRLLDWFPLGDEPELRTTTNIARQPGYAQSESEDTLATAGFSAGDTLTGNPFTINASSLTLATNAVSNTLGNGVVAEKGVPGTAGPSTNAWHATDVEWYDTVDAALETQGNISTATYTYGSVSSIHADFTVTHAVAGTSANGDTISETGTTFSNISGFANGADSTGIQATDSITFYNGGAAKIINFTNSGGSTTITSPYNTTPVNLDITEAQHDSNTKLWDRVKLAINNHTGINASATISNDSNAPATFTVIDKAGGTAANGQLPNAEAGSGVSITSTGTGGTATFGSADTVKFTIPYGRTVSGGTFSNFQTASFEIDTSTGAAHALYGTADSAHNAGNAGTYWPIAGAASVIGAWNAGFNITNDTSFWNHVKAQIQTNLTIDGTAQFDVSYDVTNPNGANASGSYATFKVTAKPAQGNSYNGLHVQSSVNQADNYALPNPEGGLANFVNQAAACGAASGDAFTVSAQGTTKTFNLADDASNPGNHTRTIDVSVSDKASFWDPLKVAIKDELEESSDTTYTVAWTDSDAGNPCSYATFTITSTATGSAYNLGVAASSNTGASLSTINNTAGTNTAGAQHGDTIIVGAQTYTITTSAGTSGNTINFNQSSATAWSELASEMNTDIGSTYTIAQSAHGSGEYSTFTITADAIGAAANLSEGSTWDDTGDSFYGRAETQAGTNATGSVSGHGIRILQKRFVFGAGTDGTPSGYYYINPTTVAASGPGSYSGGSYNDANVWLKLQALIHSNMSAFDASDVETEAVGGNDYIKRFNLTANTTGSTQNDWYLTSSHASFNIIGTGDQSFHGGSVNAGVVNGDSVDIKMQNGDDYVAFTADIDYVNNSNDTSTVVYVDSSQSSNTAWWTALKNAIEGKFSGATVAIAEDTPTAGKATFTVTSNQTGTAGNTGKIKVDSAGSEQTSFPSPGSETSFSGGSAATGATAGDTVVLGTSGATTTFTVITTGSPSSTQLKGHGHASDNAFWDHIVTQVGTALSDYGAARASNRITITSTATGSAQNTVASETGATFTIVSNAAGTNESGVLDGAKITIDGTTFEMEVAGGVSGGNTAVTAGGVNSSTFRTNLTNAITSNTDFDTVSVADLSNGFHRFSLTSSVTGTAKNVNFADADDSNRTTFQNLAGAAGGTTVYGIEDLDGIRIKNANVTDVTFKVDADGGESDSSAVKFIDISGYTGTDSEKSVDFWDALKTSIIANTHFDTIAYTHSNNQATFHITSSISGTAYNSNIKQTYDASGDGYGFSISNDTAGGTNETKAYATDTFGFDSKTWTIVNNNSPSNYQINAGTADTPVSDAAFWNSITQSIKNNTRYDEVSYTTAGGSATFHITSSDSTVTDPYTGLNTITGSAMNTSLTLSSTRTFSSATGLAGGTNGVFENVIYSEILPQPQYGYPHTLTSPGSLRNPTCKSSLGLANTGYKLRSNHFNLTRSLGYVTDGVYDNTARWDVPDLSDGLTPYDSDYNQWYQNVGTHNKFMSLVPEFRISSHVDDIINSYANNESTYFADNWWLEVTGTSTDAGVNVGRNINSTEGSNFLKEYSVSTTIRDIDKIISQNIDIATPLKITLTVDALMKFLPYEGFYPQTRTVQMANQFAKSYAKNLSAQEADPAASAGAEGCYQFPEDNAMAQARPFFDATVSPGLLFNTIKSGIAVDYPIIDSKMATSSVYDPYGGINFMVANEYFDTRIPFEALVNPDAHLANTSFVDTHPHPSASMNLKTNWNGQGDKVYKLMANNFFAESINFFLEGQKTARLVSKSESEFLPCIANHVGTMPIYRAIVKISKSKKKHPYVEFKGESFGYDADDKRLLHGVPSGETNYFGVGTAPGLGLTGDKLEYDISKISYPRPQMNPYAEIETITMYSQPLAFGPPCAGGVAVEHKGLDGSDNHILGPTNNTTYMMYDSTNGYNAPYTPPYYDGEAWALLTFRPTEQKVYTLDEIMAATEVDYLRFELNHESGSFGDRGTRGPQGFTINDNAMHIDASLNMMKKSYKLSALYDNTGGIISIDSDNRKSEAIWVIESKFETPILDFSKYLNRDYNVTFESEVTANDLYQSKMTLSGTRAEQTVTNGIYASASAGDGSLTDINIDLGKVTQLSGVMTPVGMWHQYGEYPAAEEKGIFLQIMDVPTDYTLYGTEMSIANPKWATVEVDGCNEASVGYGNGSLTGIGQHVVLTTPKQQMRRRLDFGDGASGIFKTSNLATATQDFGVVGGRIQIVDGATFEILDSQTLLKDSVSGWAGLSSVTSYITNNTTTPVIWGVRASQTYFDSDTIKVTAGGSAQSDETAQGSFARTYYATDRKAADTILTPIILNNISYDTTAYASGPLLRDGYLGAYSIGLNYFQQTDELYNIVGCQRTETETAEPAEAKLVKALAIDYTAIKGAKPTALNKLTLQRFTSKKLRLIPGLPSVLQAAPTTAVSNDWGLTGTGSYIEELHQEPTWFRGSVRYFPSAADHGSATAFSKTRQVAPANQYNYSNEPVTVRWGQFMHNQGSTALTQSLADLVGFSQEKVKMGVPAKSRVVREAVVAIPYIAKLDGQREFVSLDKDSIDKYLFENNIIDFDRNASLEYIGMPDKTSAPTSATMPSSAYVLDVEGDKQLGASIIDQIAKMQKYSLPPHIDFIERNIAPVAMYIFEFKRVFNRQELTDIWQGVRSKSLEKVEFNQKKISHFLTATEMLGELKDSTVVDGSSSWNDLSRLKWLVFKVKQKAATSYDRKMEQDLIDERFMNSQTTTQSDITDLTFGYNWPYDYFSMIENIKISADVEVVRRPEPESEVSVDTSGTSVLGSTEASVSTGAIFGSLYDGTQSNNSDSNGTVMPPDGTEAEFSTPPAGAAVLQDAGLDEDARCTLAGTLIETQRGIIPVESIVEGDRVLSYDFSKQEYDYYNVSSVMVPTMRSKWVMVTTMTGKALRCTEEHPLYSIDTDNNEMPISEAAVGDRVYVLHEGRIIADKISSIQRFTENVLVYNFEVDDVHSYISDNVLSHNKVVGTGGGGSGLGTGGIIAPQGTIDIADRIDE